MTTRMEVLDGMTDGEIIRVNAWNAVMQAEDAFVVAYTSDPNRKGMRPGDFRYRKDLRSPATQVADAFHAANGAYNRM